MTNLKSQSGRSMVEMLGVLAIIGVLSIGGIAGYTMAMNRYRANEVLNVASQLAVISQTQNRGVCPAAGDCTADLDDLQLNAAGVAGLAAGGTIVAETIDGVTTVRLRGLGANVGAAIDSITGGDGCGENANCDLAMNGTALVSGAAQQEDPDGEGGEGGDGQ